jgi:hypothetical protein
MSLDRGTAYGWDDTIEKDSEFILLEEGEYEFTVSDLDREHFEGSEKVDACPMAVVHCQITTDAGTATLKHWLLLSTKTEGLLSAFFASIGMKKKGEPMRMEWSRIFGRKGRCLVGVRSYEKDGEMRQANEIKRFLPPDDYANTEPQQKAYSAGTF